MYTHFCDGFKGGAGACMNGVKNCPIINRPALFGTALEGTVKVLQLGIDAQQKQRPQARLEPKSLEWKKVARRGAKNNHKLLRL